MVHSRSFGHILVIQAHTHIFPVWNSRQIIRPNNTVKIYLAAHILPRLWPSFHAEIFDQTLLRAKLSSPAWDTKEITSQIRLSPSLPRNLGQPAYMADTSSICPSSIKAFHFYCLITVMEEGVLHFTPGCLGVALIVCSKAMLRFFLFVCLFIWLFLTCRTTQE